MKIPARLKPFLIVLAVLAVLALAGWLRWRAVLQLPPDYDEDDYLRAAQEYASLVRSGDWNGFTGYNYRTEHPPLAKIVLGFSILAAPEYPLIPDRPTTAGPDQSLPKDLLRSGRTAGAILGTLSAGLLAIANPLAGVLLAIHTYNIKYTSQVMLEALPALTSLALVLCYLRFKRTRKDRRINAWLVASAFFLGLTAASKYIYCAAGIAVLVDWFITAPREGSRHFLRNALIWGGLSILVFFAADPYLWPDPLNRLKESVFYHVAYSSGAAEVESANFPIWQPFIWLAQSIPWHPGVFVFMLDALISLLAIFGFKRLWQKERVYGLWLIVGLGFLLVWPTKWPQYILILLAPLSLAAAEGTAASALSTFNFVRGLAKRRRLPATHAEKLETRKAVPWLLPGMIALIFLAVFPLIYQLAMSLTDLNLFSLKDAFEGGVWRAAWQGLTGQVKPVVFNPFDFYRAGGKDVQYAGFRMLLTVLEQGSSLIFFDIGWTVVSVALQAALGVGVALMLFRRGVGLPRLWQTIFILPWAIPEFIGALVWLRVFEPAVGWYSMIAPADARVNITFNNPNYAMLALLVAATWYGFPFLMLAASASLKMVPREVYDAAAIDGAGSLATLRHITVPLLLPLLIPAVIIRGIFAFNQFYLFFVMNTRFPMSTIATISYGIFFYGNQYAVSAALNIIALVMLVAFLLLFNRWSKASGGVTYA